MISNDTKDHGGVESGAGREPARHRGELRRTLLGWMLLISLVPLVVMAVEGYHCGAKAVIEKTRDHLLSVLNSRRDLVEMWLNQRFSELDVLAKSPSVARCCAHFAELSETEIDTEVTATLRSMVVRVESYEELRVYGRDWTPIARVAHGDAANLDPLPEALTRRLDAATAFVFDEPVRTASGDVVVRVGRALVNGLGEHVGAVLATLNLTRGLDPLLQDRAGMGQTGKVYLIASGRTILSEPFTTGERIALRRTTPVEYGAPEQSEPAGVSNYRDYRGQEVWGRTTPIARTTWVLVTEQDQREATAWLRTLLYRVVLTGAITLVVLVLVVFWISDRLARPLRELARVAQRIRGGQTGERLGPMPGAEAEEVRQAVNEMLDDLREKQRQLVLSATLASVGELSSSVVHEMRNPLSSIKMNLKALRRRVEGDADFCELAEIASTQVQRVEQMLEDLLQFGRGVELRPQPVSFQELVAEALAVMGEQAKAKGVRIEIDDRSAASLLYVDREQMCRALTNLVGNAVQASSSGQTVYLRAEAPVGREDCVQLEVADSGPGLSPEAAGRAFKPFFTTKPEGTGLGLANVKKIVELHGGTVSAHNRPEGGAAFVLVLPLKGAA